MTAIPTLQSVVYLLILFMNLYGKVNLKQEHYVDPIYWFYKPLITNP